MDVPRPVAAMGDGKAGLFFASGQEGSLPSQPPPRERTVLVADPEPSLAHYTLHLLTRAGYRVLTAGSGAEALAMARREPLNLIVLDLWMPDMDGFDLLAQLIALQGPRVLIFTALGRRWEEDRARRLGAVGYIEKPATPRQLLDAVQQVLGGES